MKTTILKMLRHREIVRKNFNLFIAKLHERSDLHDLSKFLEDEFDGFQKADEAGLYTKFGTGEYKKLIAENEGIRLHYQRNTHHPEHYKDGSEGISHVFEVEKMSFLDIVEMVIDWKSASETYGKNFMEGLDYSLERFRCDEKCRWLIKMIANEIK